MKKKEIIEMLNNKGYFAEETEISKNGKLQKGISVKTSEKEIIGVVIYPETLQNAEEDYIMNMIENAFKDKPDGAVDQAINIVKDREEILKKAFIVAYPITTEDKEDSVELFDYEKGIKYKFLIEIKNASITINKSILFNNRISEEELFAAAKKNTIGSTKVTNMFEVLMHMSGFEGEIPDMNDEDMMFVVTNEKQYKGAGILAIEEFFNNFCEEHKWESILVIPSSIHELIIVKDTEKNRVDEMVSAINATELNEEDILADRSFRFTHNVGFDC